MKNIRTVTLSYSSNRYTFPSISVGECVCAFVTISSYTYSDEKETYDFYTKDKGNYFVWRKGDSYGNHTPGINVISNNNYIGDATEYSSSYEVSFILIRMA